MAEASSSKPPRPTGSQSRPLSTIDEDPLRDQVECPDGRRLYNDGHPLWTREHLLFIQRQIAANPESITTYPNIGTPIEWEQPHYGDPTVDWQIVVVFEGWRFFTHPKTQLAGKNSLSSLVISGENTIIKEFDISLRQDMEKNLAKYFDSTQEIWARSRARYSIEELLSGYELPPTINKVVCFGLGNDGICRKEFERCSQHAAALTIRTYLENRLGHEVRLLTQDPGYNRTSRNILGHAGFNIVGMNGLDRFLEVDDNSLVFSVYPGVCVKEILAELARPAIIIDLPILPEDLNWAENFYAEHEKYAIEDENFDMEFQLSLFRDKANPDTPRTVEMFKEYHDVGLWSPSKEERNREEVPFWTTDMEVWVRKRGSKPRRDESSDVLSEVDTKVNSEENRSYWSPDDSSDESSDESWKGLVKELVTRFLGMIWGDVDDD